MAEIRWERTACPACGSADEDEFLRAPGDDGAEYRLAKCRRCTFVFTNPRPTADSLAALYPPDYAPYESRKLRKGGRHALRARLFGVAERSLADRIPVPPGGRLLDYGCGSGLFAAKMRGRGWDARGMDFSAHAAESARRNFGLEVIHGDLPHPAVPPNSLDAITLRAVLEHVHDPARLLRAAAAVLKPGGHLYVSVPNLDSWGFGAFGVAWHPLHLPWHLLHFTPGTLRRVVADSGLIVEAVKTRGHGRWMVFSAARSARFRPRLWAVAVRRVRPLRSALTALTEWRDRGDDLCLLARKPLAAANTVPLRKAA
jgi:SAM-dependent methyltransferase